MSNTFDLSVLFEMLTYCRPDGSSTERDFIARFLDPLGGFGDPYGNYHVFVGQDPIASQDILWSCHTDTVHRTAGRQTLHIDRVRGLVGLSKRSKNGGSSCLGADDTAGVFLCHELIRSAVPGHYVFHIGEETGGRGSSRLNWDMPDLVDRSRFAIALDRKGTEDVITSQMGQCCSEQFARSLAGQLNDLVPGLSYRPDPTGMFTDTANYTDTIGECTNLSVGYAHAHSRNEILNYRHLEQLFYALAGLDPSRLVSVRRPGDPDPRDVFPLSQEEIADRKSRSPFALSLYPSSSSSSTSSQWEETSQCRNCRLIFWPAESDAFDPETFCSDACETEDERQYRDRPSCLFPDFDEVQTAIMRDCIMSQDDEDDEDEVPF